MQSGIQRTRTLSYSHPGLKKGLKRALKPISYHQKKKQEIFMLAMELFGWFSFYPALHQIFVITGDWEPWEQLRAIGAFVNRGIVPKPKKEKR